MVRLYPLTTKSTLNRMRRLIHYLEISTVVSVFAIIILGIVGGLYRSGHEEFVGGREDPEDGKAVASTIFTAVIVYAVRALSLPISNPPS